jgi:NAD(P)-dependent dehydrogenase (short-subunit alcohol dehydrogenase family)
MSVRGVALVTGAAKRVGRAVALDLAAFGYDVAIHYNGSAADAAEVKALVEAQGRRALLVQADLADEAAVERMVPAAQAVLGPVTCLVNNASLFERDEVLTATRASWEAHQAINLRAPFVLIQAMARALPGDMSGVVINMLDQRVWNLTPHFTSYTVSKLGLWTLTQTLALALAPRIRVNGIGPGPTLPSPFQTPEQFERQCRAMPLGHGTSPEQICRAVRFILESPAMTGQMIALDGGQHLAWAFPAAEPTSNE